MSQFLIIRCENDDDVSALVELLKDELRARDWPFRIGSGEEIYYTASDIAEDISRITLISAEPEEIDDGE